MRRLGTVAQRLLSAVSRAVRAAVHLAVGFNAVPEDAAAAVRAHRGEFLDGALEAVERVRGAARDAHGEGLVVTVATDFAGAHRLTPMQRGACARRVSVCAPVPAPFPW